MSDSIVERLREIAEQSDAYEYCNKAADLIEKLQFRLELTESSVVTLGDENLHYIKQLNKTLAENEKYRKALEGVRDFDDEQECLPGCDSIAHEEFCPWVNDADCLKKIAREALSDE